MYKLHNRARYAVSSVIGIIMVLGIVATTVSGIMFWANEQINENKAISRVESVLNQFEIIDDFLSDMVSQGGGSSRTVDFVADAGYISVNNSIKTRFVLYYTSWEDYTFMLSGLEDDFRSLKLAEVVYSADAVANIAKVDIYWLNYDPPLTVRKDYPQDTNPAIINLDDGDTNNYPSFTDAVRVDIVTNAEVVVSSIFLFDMSSITFEMPSSSSTRRAILENGAIFTGRDNSIYNVNQPKIYDKGNSLAMRILQLKTDSGSIVAGGKGTYRLSMKVNNNFVWGNKVDVVVPIGGYSDPSPASFRMLVYGDHADAWKQYFKIQHGFKQFTDDPSTLNIDESETLYLEDDRVFSLTHSVLNINLEVFK